MDLGESDKSQLSGDHVSAVVDIPTETSEPIAETKSAPVDTDTERQRSSASTPTSAPSEAQPPDKETVQNTSQRVGGQERSKETTEKKGDDKLAMYKALAIKLKKELVKSREELQTLRENGQQELMNLREKVDSLTETLDLEKQTNAATIFTLETKVKDLRQQLQSSEADLQQVQNDFENYKVQASKIMQQNAASYSHSSRTFEEERYKQLKELNEEQDSRIFNLEKQLSSSLARSREFENEAKQFQAQLEQMRDKVEFAKVLESKCETLTRENENLKLALKQFRTKLKEPPSISNPLHHCDESNVSNPFVVGERTEKAEHVANPSSVEDRLEETTPRLSPSASVKDESQTTSSSSFDGSTSGYVHIKPAPFEIISRSSVLEEAQIQIDNLTKAYLESENTNSLLSEQVRALKEEIRRLQRGTERLDLAENLEYLKNIVLKFLSLDSNQWEQKQRLVPVLSTVLKLSPDETAQLNSLSVAEKSSMASSFFKL